MKLPIPLEIDECKTFVQYLELKRYVFSHIPSETFTKSWATKNRNKALGVRKGVPDYIIIVKNKLVFVEMKRRLGTRGGYHGIVSPEQAMWIEKLAKCGAYSFIAYGAEQAIAFVESIAKT